MESGRTVYVGSGTGEGGRQAHMVDSPPPLSGTDVLTCHTIIFLIIFILSYICIRTWEVERVFDNYSPVKGTQKGKYNNPKVLNPKDVK